MTPTLSAPALPPSKQTTPRQLRGMLVMVGLLAAIAVVILWWAVERFLRVEKTIEKEAVPSIEAAQQTKAGLAAMHAHATGGLLGRREAATEYDKSRGAVTAGLLKAAETITYEDKERDQIRMLLDGLGRYEVRIAAARTLDDRKDRDGMLQKVREADDLLHGELFDAAKALDKINVDALKDVYADYHKLEILFLAAVFFAGLCLVGMLVRAQVFIRLEFRRLFSPPLMLATGIAAVFVILIMIELNEGRDQLKGAREDTFESIHLMWQAKADGYTALADTRLRLLDPDRISKVTTRFEETVKRIGDRTVQLEPKELLYLVKHKKIDGKAKGYLADEFRHVTLPGEPEAAVDAAVAFKDFLEAERRVHKESGPAAIELAVGNEPGSLTVAFERFDDALDEVRRINKTEFTRQMERKSVVLRWCEYVNPLVMLSVFVLTWIGLAPRLREYAI